MKSKKICIITNKYPNKYEPNILVFLQQLTWEFARLGNECTVICPVPVNIHPKYFNLNYFEKEYTDTGEELAIYRPKYIGFGQSDFGRYNPAKITTKLFINSVLKTIKRNNLHPDIIYSHFITPAGVAASYIGKKLGIRSYMAHGEATPTTIDHIGGPIVAKNLLSNLSGVIAVSSYNKEMLTIDYKIIEPKKISVFPNGYNPNRFYKINKTEARKEMGFNHESFIVGFVGSFDIRKGIIRLQEAVDEIDDVYFACAGKGELIPTSCKCVFHGTVNNDKLLFFYNACDIFVLPTQREGCCNAIIEAMACGLPIISSDRSFNDDILDENNSIRVNPESIEEIRNAIILLKENEEIRNRLSEGSLNKAKGLTLEKRADMILKFIFGELYE